jgi:pyruvate dehydrogenase E2 component (dihydrolipoamide acetyltransferase)
MSKQNIVMPQMGESITQGTITKWNKKPGDKVELDEILLEISTDKVESEIPSPFEGRLESLHFNEGDTVDVGVVIAEIEDDLSVPFAANGNGAQGVAGTPAPKEETKAAPSEASALASVPSASTSSNGSGGSRFYTPLVRRMAKEAGVALSELDHVDGSGAGGRVNKSDFEDFLKSRGSSTSTQRETRGSTPAPKVPLVQAPTINRAAEDTIVPMDSMRRVIAKNMVASKQISPHVNSISEVDLSPLVKFRESFKGEFLKQEGIKLTYTPFIVWALIKALKDFPQVNAQVDGDNIVLKKRVNMGLAVAVPGNGLIVPVIHDADTLNMTGLCRRIDELAQKARAKKLEMKDLEGGTFTFSNVGSFGTLMANPIILQPQVGIYASGAIKKRVMVMPDDSFSIRSMMYGTLSYDHRIVDGELGGKFLEAVHAHLRELNPKELF